MQGDWRNYEYFRCVGCGKKWRRWFNGAYEATDTDPVYQDELCEECIHGGQAEPEALQVAPAVTEPKPPQTFIEFVNEWLDANLAVMAGKKVGRA